MMQRHPNPVRPEVTRSPPRLIQSRARAVVVLGLAWALGLGAILASCERTERSGAQARQAVPGTSAPFDIGAVMRRVHFAWRPEQEGFGAGHSTYSARAGTGGWSFTPYASSPELGMEQGPALHLRTVSLSRGGQLLTGSGPAEVSEDGSLVLARGAAVERLRNAEDGVHPSWEFARRPGGSGALTVRLRAEGAPYTGQTAAGLHFAALSGPGVRYGEALWTDAGGASTRVPARYEAGQIVLEVPASVVESAAYPAVLGPTVSPEFGMDNPVSGPVARIQSFPDVAFDGQNFLVVWQDSRGSGTTDVYDIFGARVSASGAVLDPSGFVISNAVGDQKSPAVAFDGQRYLVVWADSRSGSPRIHGSRVTVEGVVLEPDGMKLNTGTAAQTWPTLAFDGTNYLVAWQDFRGGTATDADIWGTRVSPSGAVVDPDGFAICVQPYAQAVPDMAFDGQNYFLVWQDQRAGGGGHVFGGRVSPSGDLLDGQGFAVSTPVSVELSPAVAFDGTNYLVVWQDDRAGLSYDIYGRRVSPNGTKLDSADFVIVSLSLKQQAPALAFDGQNYLVTWEDARSDSALDVYGARVSPQRVVSTTFAILTGTGGQVTPAVAVGAGVSLVVASDTRSGSTNADIYGARVGPSGGPLDSPGVLISSSASSQLAPAVASDGHDYLVVWQDDRRGAYDIYGVLVQENGMVLDPSGIALSTATGNQTSPVVVHDGQGYFVAWQDQRNGNADIYGTRVSSAGQVLDPSGIAISARAGSQNRPAAAASSQGYLVAWYDDRVSSSPDIYGARVGLDGTVLDPSGFIIGAATGSQLVPAAAFDGQNYFVVWHDFRNGATGDIYGARVTPQGSVLDTPNLPIAVVGGSQTSVAVAFGGPGYFVAWRDLRNPSADVYGARVLPDGTVLDPGGFAVSDAADDQAFPAVGYDGQDYVVAWQHSQASGPNDIVGARVSTDGIVLDPSGFAIAVDASDESAPRLSGGSAGHLLIAYQRMDLQSPYGSQRVRGRILTTYGEVPDAGTPDADGGSDAPDAGTPDAGTVDAGTDIPDAGEPDAGTTDAGIPEGGGSDAGTVVDGGDTTPADAGPPDAGDTAPDDAGAVDAGTDLPDAGEPDGGTVDASTPDNGDSDAGTVVDAGDTTPDDAGTPDAGSPDAGAPDAGQPDASTPPPGPVDSGTPDPGVTVQEGCGCSGTNDASGFFLSGLLAVLALNRRRHMR